MVQLVGLVHHNLATQLAVAVAVVVAPPIEIPIMVDREPIVMVVVGKDRASLVQFLDQMAQQELAVAVVVVLHLQIMDAMAVVGVF
jgi:hypothetical protein